MCNPRLWHSHYAHTQPFHGMIGLVVANRYRSVKAAQRRRDVVIDAENAHAALEAEQANKLFDAADLDGSGLLEGAEICKVIAEVVGQSVPDRDYLQIVAYATGSVTPTMSTAISRPEMPKLLAATKAYAEQNKMVDRLLAEHDKNGDGRLDVRELLDVMRSVAPGVSVRAGDVLWLLEKCDLDGDSHLSRDELLPALSLWHGVAGRLPRATSADDENDASIEETLDALRDSRIDEAEAVVASSGYPLGLGANPLEQRLRERVHPLQGAKIEARGGMKSRVRTLSGRQLIVSNKELKQAKHAVQEAERQRQRASTAAKR